MICALSAFALKAGSSRALGMVAKLAHLGSDGTSMRKRRLLSHLARFGSFSKQGELLCTQGLTYLLENQDARAAFGVYLSKLTGRTVGPDLTWRAEVGQQDRGRPDLEACTVDGKPVAKIEAKLGAALGEGQLASYLCDFQNRSGVGLLLVLVPRHRIKEMHTSVPSACHPFVVNGDGPWQPIDASGLSVAVICWEEILEVMGAVCSEPFSGDLAQFRAMYRVLIGDDIEPITSDAEVLAWREKEGVYVNLVDRVTRRLTREGQVLPMGSERLVPMDSELDRNDYQRRYVCLPLGDKKPCFSVGAREPFAGYVTPSGCDSTMRRPGSQLSAIALTRPNCRNDWSRAAGTFGYRLMSQGMLTARV